MKSAAHGVRDLEGRTSFEDRLLMESIKKLPQGSAFTRWHQRRMVRLLGLWMAGWGVLLAVLSQGNSAACWLGLAMLPVAAGVWLLDTKGYSRLAAGGLVFCTMALSSALVWLDPAYITTVVLVLAIAVAFAAWELGGTAGIGSAGVMVVVGMALAQRGDVAWHQVLLVGYVTVFLLAMIGLMLKGSQLSLITAHHSLGTLAQQQEQIDVLFQAVEQNPESILVVDLQGRVVYANSAFEQRTGYRREDAIGLPSRQVSLNGLTAAEHQHMREVVDSGEVWQGVVRNVLKDGTTVVDAVRISPVVDAQQHVRYLVESRQDISEKVAHQDHIRHLQEHDGATQLLNVQGLRVVLDEYLAQEPDQHQPTQWHALLLLEIDRFQIMESVKGSAWSVALIQSAVQRLQALLPASTHWARTGDGELAVLVQGAGVSRYVARMQAYEYARDMRGALQTLHMDLPEEGGLEMVQLTCSMGFTVFPFIEPGLQQDKSDYIVRRATVALSQARHQGGDHISAYSEDVDANVQRRMQVERELGQALKQGDQLQVFLQPQVNVTGRVAGLEALVRWQHPEKGMVSPGDFIPVAEDSGLIVPLGDWMLREVCGLLNDPRMQQSGASISVNVSALQLLQADFVEKVQKIVRSTEINPRKLVLEITESMLLQDVDAVIQKIVALHALGIGFAMDDFGTGYSSLAYLARLPIQEIKLDQVFVRDLQVGSQTCVLVEAVLMVAKSRGLRVVAEGVETVDQAQLLQALEPSILCQGYLFRKPCPAQVWLEDPQVQVPF